ncbi:MAG: hypothetical protein AVDCRST_MAG27-96, partial [uncultured Craurococcus sp.]
DTAERPSPDRQPRHGLASSPPGRGCTGRRAGPVAGCAAQSEPADRPLARHRGDGVPRPLRRRRCHPADAAGTGGLPLGPAPRTGEAI